ncbi:MAG TPA: AAA family ATPase [Solirubrobacteraceae bacterium]|nr:AAA family ATPase [Solirubrobacteraceae bacterium]
MNTAPFLNAAAGFHESPAAHASLRLVGPEVASTAAPRDHGRMWVSDAQGLDATELLERSGQLGELTDRLADVIGTPRGWVILVRGEAGIGKTALLHGFRGSLNRAVRVLWAACDPLFTPRPLGPLLDVARSVGGELRAQLDRGAKPHDVAAALMSELEAPAPTVLILEDLHWADEATLDVVRLVSQRVRSLPVLLVVTYRDEQVHRSHPLRIVLGELAGGDRVRRVELRGLSRASVAALAEGSTVDPDLLYDRTSGNPFFVTEALAADTDGVPGTVRDAVLARAARLSAPARATLDAVAVVPQRTEVWLLEALVAGTLDALEECLSSGMLRGDEGGIAFRHELARLAIQESLAPDRAVALHRRALAALADPNMGSPDLARLAHHAEAAADAPAVLRYAPAAAEHASAVGSPREAQEQYGRALRFAQGLRPELRADLLERFGDAAYLTDMREEGVQALTDALSVHRARGDLRRQGIALRLKSRLLTCMGRTAEAKAAAVEAIGLLEQCAPGADLARAYSALSHTCMLADDTDETLLWGERAIALAERVGDTEALVNALNNVGTNELNRGLAAGRVKLERSLALARQAALGPDAGRAYINLVGALARHREWAQADQYLDPGIEYCREHGLEAWLKCLVAGKASARLAQGCWDDAAELAASILDGPHDSVVGPRHDALLVLALVRARRGDPQVWPLLDEAQAITDDVGDLQFLAPTAAARAEALWLEGRSDAVAAETQRALDLALALSEPGFAGELALWRRRAGLLTEPPPGVDELYREQLSGDWSRAADAWREHGCVYEAALALADSDDTAALRRALDHLQELGARPAAAIAARRLRELGEHGLPRGPRPQTRENPAGLTARQLQVLPLLAEGLRNAEIAQRLVVSPKTVDHHVSAILGKLGVHSRGEAVAEAGRLGLT